MSNYKKRLCSIPIEMEIASKVYILFRAADASLEQGKKYEYFCSTLGTRRQVVKTTPKLLKPR